MPIKSFKYLLHLFFLILLISCNLTTPPDQTVSIYSDSIFTWKLHRAEELTAPDGWLALAGRYWLKDGLQFFGTDRTNTIVFPPGSGPDTIGSIIVKDGQITAYIQKDVIVYCNGQPVKEMVMATDASGKPTFLSIGTLKWCIIKRNDRFALRLWDSENRNLREFKGLEYFPVDPAWNVQAKFIPYDPPKKLPIATVIGSLDTMISPGYLSFSINGKHLQLDPVQEPGDTTLFIIIADETSGVETYGGGRFLYASLPPGGNRVTIDFNKAYNPPCAFTEYATCPLPPDQNKLKVMITAGEKAYGGH